MFARCTQARAREREDVRYALSGAAAERVRGLLERSMAAYGSLEVLRRINADVLRLDVPGPRADSEVCVFYQNNQYNEYMLQLKLSEHDWLNAQVQQHGGGMKAQVAHSTVSVMVSFSVMQAVRQVGPQPLMANSARSLGEAHRKQNNEASGDMAEKQPPPN